MKHVAFPNLLMFALISSSFFLPINQTIYWVGEAIPPNNGGLHPRSQAAAIIADHSVVNLTRFDQIPEAAINLAKNNLHIAYGHTSHGSQLITGMSALPAFKEGLGGTESLYDWHDGPLEGALDIDDYFMSGDLGHLGDLAWATSTRTYLDRSENADVNVVMWSWCGGVSDNTEAGINAYLNEMAALELEYPTVTFVYMTGHADGTGESGNLHIRNQQIRNFCIANNKTLYDFYNIECYNPDGAYFGDKAVNDNCDYDSDSNGIRDANWALAWQTAHTEDIDWFSCSPAHSQALNGNLKAYGAWWLFCSIAGWDSGTTSTGTTTTSSTTSSSTTTSSTSTSTTSSSMPISSTSTSSSTDSIGEWIKKNFPIIASAGLGIGFLGMVALVVIVAKKSR